MRSSLVTVLVLTACGTTAQFAATNPSPRPLTARAAETVSVFATGLPDQPFVEVGIIQARQSSEFSVDELPEILAERRVEAGRRGCDGLVINGTRDSSSSTNAILGHTSSSRTLEGFWGACIVFVEPAPALAQRAGAERP